MSSKTIPWAIKMYLTSVWKSFSKHFSSEAIKILYSCLKWQKMKGFASKGCRETGNRGKITFTNHQSWFFPTSKWKKRKDWNCAKSFFYQSIYFLIYNIQFSEKRSLHWHPKGFVDFLEPIQRIVLQFFWWLMWDVTVKNYRKKTIYIKDSNRIGIYQNVHHN